jgi:cytochrome P450
MTVDSPTAGSRPYHRFNVSDYDFWNLDFRARDATFHQLRAEPGLSWQPPRESAFGYDEPGYWAVTRHEDIKHVSQNSELFTSAMGVAVDPTPMEIQRISTFFLTMDPPEHARYRRLISSAFTPKQVRLIESQIKVNAAAVVDDLLEALTGGDEINFISECAAKLPMRTVSDMIGNDSSEREKLSHAADALFSSSDDETVSFEDRAGYMMAQLDILTGSGIRLAQLRREEPREDLMTNIVNAEVDGQRLTDGDIGAFMVLLAAAGNDTTKQTTTHTLKALYDNPSQLQWLREDFDNRIDIAVEEFVRWSTPVIAFARHAKVDTEVAGTQIKAGEKLVLFYCSANRDEDVFDRPHQLDLSRSPNHHFGFGGGGVHFCLGSQLAKMQLRHLFHQLVTRLPDVEVGELSHVNNNMFHVAKFLPIQLA